MAAGGEACLGKACRTDSGGAWVPIFARAALRSCAAVRPAVLSEHSRSEQTDSQQNTLTLADRTVQSGRTLRAAGLRTDGTAARTVSKVTINRALARTRADNIAENWPLAEHEEQSEADSVLSLSVTAIMRKQIEHDVLKMKNNSNPKLQLYMKLFHQFHRASLT